MLKVLSRNSNLICLHPSDNSNLPNHQAFLTSNHKPMQQLSEIWLVKPMLSKKKSTADRFQEFCFSSPYKLLK